MLTVAFTDGRRQQIDVWPVLHGAVFGPLQDLATFNAVTLDHEVRTLTWSNDADFDPATLHDWPEVCDELAARARAWGETNTDPTAGQHANGADAPLSVRRRAAHSQRWADRRSKHRRELEHD